MSDLGIVIRTAAQHLDRIERDAREGNCAWAQFHFEQMRQKSVNDSSYAALLPQAEQAVSSCANTTESLMHGLGGAERINATFQNRKEPLTAMASLNCDAEKRGGWKTCKKNANIPPQVLDETQFNPKYAEHKSPTLVTRGIEGADITPQNMGTMTRACTRSGSKTKPLREAHVELVMLPADVASTAGTAPGPHIRMCSKVNSDGLLVPVRSPEETLQVAAEFRKCQRGGETAEKCARRKSQVIG